MRMWCVRMCLQQIDGAPVKCILELSHAENKCTPQSTNPHCTLACDPKNNPALGSCKQTFWLICLTHLPLLASFREPKVATRLLPAGLALRWLCKKAIQLQRAAPGLGQSCLLHGTMAKKRNTQTKNKHRALEELTRPGENQMEGVSVCACVFVRLCGVYVCVCVCLYVC